MPIAALTFVFNEAINLPIWIKYYGKNFGERNLFVVDRESTDGSTDNLGEVNKIIIPRDAFDDKKKADFLSSMQNALLNYYEAVVCGDCDELVVPNIGVYENLADYVSRTEFDYVTSVGLNVSHVITLEPPLNLERSVLAQRRYAHFRSATCKTSLSRVPIKWLPGLHSLNRRPNFDLNLFLFHTKWMDYGIASARQQINRDTEWSDTSLSQNWGAHHRYEYDQFVREGFLDIVNAVSQNKILPFQFAEEISKFNAEVIERDGFYWIPMKLHRWVEIPANFREAF
jgi:hypothetical protein